MVFHYALKHQTDLFSEITKNMEYKCPGSTKEFILEERAIVFIGSTSLAFGGYLGVLFQHKFLTSNVSNKTDILKSVIRLIGCCGIVWVIFRIPTFVSWTNSNLFKVYLTQSLLPCFLSSFVILGITDMVFELVGLLNRDFSKNYCIFFHSDTTFDKEDPRLETLLDYKNNLYR